MLRMVRAEARAELLAADEAERAAASDEVNPPIV